MSIHYRYMASVLVLVMELCIVHRGFSQENVFQLFNGGSREGNAFFDEGSYSHALRKYLEEDAKGQGSPKLYWKIAVCHYKLHQYKEALDWASRIDSENFVTKEKDRLLHAGILTANGLYSKAIDVYNLILKANPDSEAARRHVWRLKNIKFLYEDSLHYSVTKMPWNSSASEIAAVTHPSGVLFLSNARGQKLFEQSDLMTGEVSYKAYLLKTTETNSANPRRTLFNRQLTSKWQNGPIAFYDGYNKAIVCRSDGTTNRKGRMALQLFEAERKGRAWKIVKAFPHCDPEYTYTDPFMSAEGDVLYFSSDRKGGLGGSDLYRCRLVNGKWMEPENLGDVVNTPDDETSPFIFRNTFYFASDGHAGMGGIDIYKCSLIDGQLGDVLNAGFPINSPADDFALSFAPDGSLAYFSSNRGDDANDDIYQLEIDLQTYPVVISGDLKFKAFSLSDTSRLYSLPNARMFLIDHTRETVIEEVKSDDEGRFTLTIPYFSRYKIRVVEQDGAESIVSLDIPRQKREDYTHQIVVVKDAFESKTVSPKEFLKN